MKMRIAIASSGLGHINRGMEAWAESLAFALYERGADVTLFKGAGKRINDYDVILPTLSRNSRMAKLLAKITQKFFWRIGLGYPAGVELFIFAVQLLLKVRKGYDIIHIQQGSLADFLLKAEKLGLLKIPFVFANGQKGNEEFFKKFKYIQHLTPLREDPDFRGGNTSNDENRFIIPNFVDSKMFIPGNKEKARRQLDLPIDKFIILTVGLIDVSVKKMDYFIDEMLTLTKVNQDFFFLIAGSEDKQTKNILKYGNDLLNNNLRIFIDFPHSQMPLLYQSADLFVLCSPQEAFGLVLVEAMSTMLPVIYHQNPIMKWVVSDAGIATDMTIKGNLASTIKKYYKNSEYLKLLGQKGRARVSLFFDKNVVTDSIQNMYRTIKFDS